MKRGGQPEAELEHARLLLGAGAETVWGWDSPGGRERVKARVRWLTAVCGLRPGVRVLECGCGTGIFTRRLASSGATIVAVDISAALLREARKACPAENVTFLEDNLEAPKHLKDEFFDVLCGVSVLHHLDLPRCLSLLRDKLKPGGTFAFSEPNLLNPINRYLVFTDDPAQRRRRGVSPTEMAFRPRELRALFEKAGFEIQSLQHRDFVHPSVPPPLLPLVKAGSWVSERTPLVKRWSGSLWIHGRRP